MTHLDGITRPPHKGPDTFMIKADEMARRKPMSADEYRRAIERLGVGTQDKAADFLDVSLRTSHGYANGAPIPTHVAMLLRLMLKHGIKPEDV